MTWIKQNYDRFVLALVALALAACAGLLFKNALNFNSVFASLKEDVPHDKELPLETTRGANHVAVEKIQEQLAKPSGWEPRMISNRRLPLFVSVPYIQKENVLIDPYNSNQNLHPPATNDWLIKNNQNLLDSNVLEQDTDGDGFSTLDEFTGKTDPQDKGSHPPYWTKLYLNKFVRIPFVLRFDAKNGEKYLVNSVDEEEPSQFVKLNEIVTFKKINFKVTKYVEKSRMDGRMKRDVSELTLVNQENGQVIVLPKQEEVDSPTTYVVFNYRWNGSKDFAVLKGNDFSLPPDDKVKYKLLELSDTEIKVLKVDENKQLSIRRRQ